jgi:hypothetical protein
MAKIAILFGVLLTMLGLGFYLVTAMVSPTALIPAFVGVPLAVLGGFAYSAREGVRKHLMHAAAMLGLLGVLAPMARLIAKGFGGAAPAVAEQVLMAVVCLVFVGLCVNSFVQARRSPPAA